MQKARRSRLIMITTRTEQQTGQRGIASPLFPLATTSGGPSSAAFVTKAERPGYRFVTSATGKGRAEERDDYEGGATEAKSGAVTGRSTGAPLSVTTLMGVPSMEKRTAVTPGIATRVHTT